MGLHIARVEIQNFRNFEHLIVDPFPASAVIVGENGVGKSNLLYALRILLDPTLPESARMLRSEDFHEGAGGVSMADGGTVRIAVDFAGFDADVDALSVLADFPMPGVRHRARVTYEFRPRVPFQGHVQGLDAIDRPALTTADYEYAIFGGEHDGTDGRRLRRDIAIRVLPALRDAESDLLTWRKNPLRDLLEQLPLDAGNLAATAQDVSAAMDRLRGDPSVTALEAALTRRLNDMMGARNPVKPTFGFASTDADDLVRFIRLFIDQARRRTVGDTSLGGANVLYLALLLEALAAQRRANAFVATILAVEEPEAHLHVTLQRLLFRHLTRSEPALILTTHSPHIAAVAPLSSYVLLRQSPRGTVASSTAGLGIDDAARQDLERYMDQSRSELLFAKYVILVEGLAEAYLMPAIAHALNFNLDEYGIVVAAVQGTDFGPYVSMLGDDGLRLPYIVITDGDPGAPESAQREGGLRRAVVLAPPHVRDGFKARVLAFLTGAPGAPDRSELVAEATAFGVFVGEATLELDLAVVMPDEILAAYEELPHPKVGGEEVAKAVEAERNGTSTVETRRQLLSRISGVGKGRYAQRLSGHITNASLSAARAANPDLMSALHLLRGLQRVAAAVKPASDEPTEDRSRASE